MCEQTEIHYLDGEVVWVKLGSCWWPGEVFGFDKLPPGVLSSFRKPPIAVVKFFQEDKFEYVRNINSVYKYNCSRKNEFIRKGLDLYRSKHGPMEKFPEDVIRAEAATNGDVEILNRDEFQEIKKESYAGLFGDTSKKTPISAKKGKNTKMQHSISSTMKTSQMLRYNKSDGDYKVHILVQGTRSSTPSQTEDLDLTPSTSQMDFLETSDSSSNVVTPKPEQVTVSTSISNSRVYACHACPFTTTRMNIMVHHNKTHSATFIPYTPSPVRKKPIKTTPKSTKPKSSTFKTPKSRKTHKDKPKLNSSQALKRAAEEEIHDTDKKKIKTDEEIKSSLLADWEDMEDEESPEELLTVPTNTSEIPIPSESASVPATAESSVPELCSDTPLDENTKYGDNCSPTIEKPNSSSDSKYEFCEDEDWSLEADAGRKIPRVKNPSKKRTDVQSSSVEEDDVAREVAELLDKTAVPELPSVPESLKVEENFPELPIAKSPDKIPEKYPDNTLLATTPSDKNTLEVQQKKTIFKTKTFFRSRHSRSQDAIGKYVAEQLNAAERMDPAESEINGAESVPSPELRESPPVDHVRVARLAPKIQLKKMKAEAQLREKTSVDFNIEDGVLSFAVSQEVVDVEDGHISQDTCSKKESQNKVDDNNIGESKSIIDDFLNDENNCNQTNITSQKDANLETHLQVKSSDEQYKESESLEKNCLETEHTNTDANLFETRTSTNPHYMNETTASAVDALLSVSRETDRVTKIISNDLPEELFEDEQKDNLNANALNGLDDKNILTNGENSSSEHNIVEEIVENNHKEGSETVDSIEQLQSINKDDITNDPEIDEKETKNGLQNAIDGTPSESDLQIAEALINLPSTTLHSKSNEEISLDSKTEPEVSNVESIKEFTVDVNTTDCFISSNKNELQDENNKPVCEENVNNVAPEDVAMTTKQNDKDCNLEPLIQENKCESDMNNIHFESEQEKSDNLNAAQSLVQMSETLDHSTLNTDNCINNLNETPILSIEDDNETTLKTNNETDENPLKKETVTELKPQNDNDNIVSSKLLKILEETSTSKVERLSKISPQKQMIVQNKEKILNFNVCKSPLKNAPQSPKQKIIIRRTNSNKNMINALSDPSQDKIILSKSTKTSQDGSSVPTYTIQASPDVSCDSSTIVIQQKVRKLQNSSKAQKTKPQTSLVNISPNKILEKTDDTLFDISSMPIVLSEDLNPENLEKMPIVMTDGNMVSSTQNQSKPKQSVIAEKEIHSGIKVSNKTDIKTLIMNAVTENNRSTTPNIISKASKLKSGKPMIIIDKLTGKQRIILPKQEITPKEVKSNTPKSPISGQPNKSEKFIILPANSSPRSSRPQKIVIDPQSGKAHILIGKSEGTASAMLPAPVALTPSAIDSKPVSAKLIPAVADSSNAGGTVMIITDAQGTQSRILLTSEHEKLLFPNKQQTITQIKTVPQRQTIVSAGTIQKTQTVITTLPQTLPIKNQTRLVPKQRGAIITSKGQLIVGGRIATKTSQSVTTLPEIRPATSKRIISSNPTKVIQTVQKANKVEPLIFLQQKSGTVMQLTAAQFEHLQRTGQIVQRTPIQMQPVMQENKIVVQKTVTVTSGEPVVPIIQKQKGRMIRPTTDAPTPPKKVKPLEIAPVPALTPINSNSTPVVTTSTVGVYPDLDNFEELLPSTAIARQPEQTITPQPTVVPAVTPTPTSSLAPQATSPTTAVSASHPAPLSDGQLLAVPGEHFGGPQGTFYLCVEDNGTFTAIDNRPLVLENNQLVPMVVEPVLAVPERRDILEAALANSDVFHAEPPRDDGPDFHDLNVNVSVHCRVSETSTTLNQPIMTPVEVPTKAEGEPAVPANLEAGLAVIGVTPPTIPTSLDLPITVTDPRIAPKTTDPLSGGAYVAALLPSPNTDMTYVGAEEAVTATGLGRGAGSTDIGAAPISMPLLTEEEDTVGKSMPILTDDVGERAASSVDSTVGSPSSLETRDTELDEGGWSQRLLTPSSDSSDNSAEIPLQPALQLSTADLNRNG